MKLIYNVSDKPKFGQLIVFAIQQLLAILAATIAVPAIVGNGMSQSAALFGAGVGTIVYLLFTKFSSPVFLGSSFAFIGSMLAAFAGGVAAVAASYLISRKSAHSHTLSLVLTGSMIMALCNAGVTMIKYVADPNDVLQQITFWLMGSLTKTDMDAFLWSFPPMAAGLAVILLLRWQLNLLTLEEEEARSLGIHIRRYRLLFIAASTLLSAAAVCLGGLIGWVGLMIPHLARALVGVDYGRLIPASAMLGAGYLVLMDDLARSLLSMELPLGVVTSIMGAPFFVYLIIKKKERR